MGKGGKTKPRSRPPKEQSRTDQERKKAQPQRPRSILKRKWPLEDINKVWLILPPLVMAVLALVVVMAEKLLGGPMVNAPLDVPKAVSDDWRNDSVYNERLWGSYRSNVYFGMRPRIPHSLLSGLMWFVYDGQFNIRHTCEHGDHLQRYGWIKHDGTSFGQQEIIDNGISLKTDFVTTSDLRAGDTWTARISAQSPSPVLASFIFYVFNEGAGEMAFVTSKRNTIEELYGHTPEFSEFRVHFNHRTLSKDAVHNYMSVRRSSITQLSDYIKSVMRSGKPHQGKEWPTIARLPGDIKDPEQTKFKPNLVAYQITTYLPFEIDMVFEIGAFSATLSVGGERFTTQLANRVDLFDKRFEDTFQLKAKGFGDSEVSFAKAAFSNLIGGISYFYGKSKVISSNQNEPLDYWAAPLYTAVPSRSFFPRGFLWDEGFHQLLVAHWDITIVKDVLAHWLDLINREGWIPREQILGDEARSKVPHEFVVQHNENANPPTFFLTLETLIQQMQRQDKMDLVFLRHIYPRLEVWFQWFNLTQAGEKPLTYRWRGRNETTDRELNPKTLTSGLDDYPRASHPSPHEYHIDLRCWMTLASGVMAKIADLIGEKSQTYRATHRSLADQRLLDKLHWDPKRRIYSDYGLHTSAVKLVRVSQPNPHLPSYKRRKVSKEPSLRFVNSFGYVNLFPFLLKLVSPLSEQLGSTLDRLANKTLLWTDYGLRSLSKRDSFYNKYNTEHDPPYWRGAIWLNMNYLACRALHHYSEVEGPYKLKAEKLYTQLRSNLIDNMHRQYIRSGYIWEQYDDQLGTGKGTHPFTGWSSLIVLIMAEKY